AGAAAEVAGQQPADLVALGGTGGRLEQFGGGHEDAGGAESALEGEVPRERRLERVERAVPVAGRQSFHRGDFGTVSLAGQEQAGADGDAVEPDGAGAADAVLAA